MNREDELRLMLDALAQEYKAKTQPLVDELVAIEALRPQPNVIFMTREQFEKDGLGSIIGQVFKNIAEEDCGDPNCPYCKGSVQ